MRCETIWPGTGLRDAGGWLSLAAAPFSGDDGQPAVLVLDAFGRRCVANWDPDSGHFIGDFCIDYPVCEGGRLHGATHYAPLPAAEDPHMADAAWKGRVPA